MNARRSGIEARGLYSLLPKEPGVRAKTVLSWAHEPARRAIEAIPATTRHYHATVILGQCELHWERLRSPSVVEDARKWTKSPSSAILPKLVHRHDLAYLTRPRAGQSARSPRNVPRKHLETADSCVWPIAEAGGLAHRPRRIMLAPAGPDLLPAKSTGAPDTKVEY